MTPVDDLRVGMWVTVVGNRHLDQVDDEPERFSPFSMFGGGGRRQPPSYSGSPVKILAISLPFIAVSDGTGVDSLDMRVWQVKKVTKKYATTLLKARRRSTSIAEAQRSQSLVLGDRDPRQPAPFDPSILGMPKEEPKPLFHACPVCHGPMTQTLKESEREWKLVCKECGFSGGRPGSGVQDDP